MWGPRRRNHSLSPSPAAPVMRQALLLQHHNLSLSFLPGTRLTFELVHLSWSCPFDDMKGVPLHLQKSMQLLLCHSSQTIRDDERLLLSLSPHTRRVRGRAVSEQTTLARLSFPLKAEDSSTLVTVTTYNGSPLYLSLSE